MKINKPLYNFSIYGFLLSLGILLIGGLAAGLDFDLLAVLLEILGAVLAAFFYLLVWISAKQKPGSVDFGELKTFRDMVNCIVDGDTQ
jgi:hypothetical protein